MIVTHCSTADAAAQFWRMLCHVPAAEFRPVEVVIAGRPAYRVVRDQGGEQTTVPPSDRLV